MTTTGLANHSIALGSGNQPPAAPNNDLGKDAFLQLLVTQLRNQDPTNPQDGQEFVAQLATFSQVEQLTGMSDALGTMNEGLGFMSGQLDQQTGALDGILAGLSGLGGPPPGPSLVEAAALIGKPAETGSAVAQLDGGGGSFGLRLDAPAESVRVVVRNAEGAVVRTFEAGARAAGEHQIAFDGRDDSGDRLPGGAYSATFEPGDGAQGFTRGTIERVGLDGGVLHVWMDGLRVPAASLATVG